MYFELILFVLSSCFDCVEEVEVMLMARISVGILVVILVNISKTSPECDMIHVKK